MPVSPCARARPRQLALSPARARRPPGDGPRTVAAARPPCARVAPVHASSPARASARPRLVGPPALPPAVRERARARARAPASARPPARVSAPFCRAGNRRMAARQAGPENALAAAAQAARRPRAAAPAAARGEVSWPPRALGRRAFAALSIAGMFNFPGLGPGPVPGGRRRRSAAVAGSSISCKLHNF